MVVDTTVLVYAVGEGHPLRHPCRRLIELVTAGSLAATTTVEVIQEFVHVRARRRSRADAASLGADFATVLSPLLSPSVDDLRAGLRLFTEVEQLGAFEAVLAATARAAGAAGLVSADGAFAAVAAVAGLRHLDPAAPGFEEALTGG